MQGVLRLAGALVGTGILLGAFGAHGLASVLSVEHMAVYKTAVQYQIFNGIGLLVLSLGASRLTVLGGLNRLIGVLVASIGIFSGSLYAYLITGASFWVTCTPIGGVGLVTAWVWLAVGGRLK